MLTEHYCLYTNNANMFELEFGFLSNICNKSRGYAYTREACKDVHTVHSPCFMSCHAFHTSSRVFEKETLHSALMKIVSLNVVFE